MTDEGVVSNDGLCGDVCPWGRSAPLRDGIRSAICTEPANHQTSHRAPSGEVWRLADDDAIVKSRLDIRVMAANQEMRMVSVAVEYEHDEDADPDDRIICSVAEFSVVVTGPDMKLAGARMETLVREQIARMKALGVFRQWVNKKLEAS